MQRSALVLVAALTLGSSWAPAAQSPHRIELLRYAFDPLVDGEPLIPAELRGTDESPYALLQLSRTPTAEDLEALRAAGVVFHDPIAGNAYLVRLRASPQEIAALPQVRWLGPLHGAYKIDPAARGGTLLVSLFPDADVEAIASEVRAAGAEILKKEAGSRVKLLVVEAGRELLSAIAAIDGVRFVQDEPVYRLVNDNARFVVQTNERGVLPLYEHGLSGAGQVGGVSDSGLDAYDFDNASGATAGTDPLDAGCYFVDDGNNGLGGAQRTPGVTHRKVVSYRVPTGAEGDYTDESGHGTHVVGSVVGDQPPWDVVSPADGQAYRARIAFQDLNVGGGLTVSPPSNYYDDLFGAAYDPDGNGLYEAAVEPRTHSNSWGGADSTYDAGTEQVDLFMWDHPDFLILYAAGNNGPAPLTVGNPGTAKDIVTVGATENGNGDPNNMADFSSHGPIPLSGPVGGTNRLSPTVAAPGTLVSALYKEACGTQELSGTSMATPTTHGVSLLLRQYLWDGYYPHGQPTAGDERQSPPPSAALLKALLINSGERMTGLYTDNGTGGSWPSNGQGWGRVKADDALYFQGDHRDLWLHDEYALNGSVGLASAGESRTFTLQVGNGSPFETSPLEVTLVWTDYPGTMLDGGRLVNDLNLVVTDPGGGTHRGNDPAQNDFNNAGDLPPAPDAVNPWETVYLANPQPGTYTVTVTAAALGSLAPDPSRKQGFALVATGDLRSSRGRAEIEKRTYDPIPTAVARLRVTDLDRNQSPSPDSITVNVNSTTNPGGITVTLTETSPTSATFTGQVTLRILDQGQVPSPGQLSVHSGDLVRLSYADANDGTGQAYEAFDTARIEDPAVTLLNPPELADPGAADPDGSFSLTWAPAESSNNRGLTRTLALYVVEEATDYTLTLFDDAQGSLSTYWTTEAPGDPGSPPWQQAPVYNHTPGAAPGQSYWSTANDTVFAFDTSLTLTQPITIPATVGSARVTFFSRFFNEPDDTGNVEVSTNNGNNWTKLLSISDAPSQPPADTRVQHHDVDLTAYRGQPIRLRFRMNGGDLNYFLFTTTGWWVDDVTVGGATWRTVGIAPAHATQFEVTGRNDGQYFYRVRAVYTDGSATAFSNVQDMVVQGASNPAGSIEGTLTLGKSGSDVTLQWGASCQVSDGDYAVYEGTLGAFTSHASRLCSTGGATSATLTPAAASSYYLVVPLSGTREGSYGASSTGERPAAVTACKPQQIGACP